MQALERAAYISLISLCLVSGVTLARRNMSHHIVDSSRVMPTEKDLTGKRLELTDLDNVDRQGAAVLFISSHCHFCDASMPFYERLVALERESQPKHVPLVIISREPVRDIEEHLASHHVVADHIYQVPSTFTLLRGTPTILFVDKAGMIQHVFMGQLNSAKEKQVLELLGTTRVDLTCQASQECSA